MEIYVATKVDDYKTGKISRRQLIEALTVAATTAYAEGAKAADADPALKVALVNHVSYTCTNFQQAALACAGTVLLESGPGQATRCAPGTPSSSSRPPPPTRCASG